MPVTKRKTTGAHFTPPNLARLVAERVAALISGLKGPLAALDRYDPAFVLIDVHTPDGQASGLGQDSMVSGLFLATVFADQVDGVIGKLSAGLMQKVDACLKVALALQ